MTFVTSSNAGKPISMPAPSIGMPKLPDLTPEPTVEDLLDSFGDDEEDWGLDEEDDFFNDPPAPKKNLTMKRNKPRNLTMKR